jgi:hypothetical protein
VRVRKLLFLFLAAAILAGCGLNVKSADLFLLQRTGQPGRLSLLVNDGGTISCDGGKARPLPDPLLIQARAIASDLDKDAKASLKIPPSRGSVGLYTIKLQDGTISFPDTAAASHHELAEAEQFAVQAAQQACGLSG